MYPLNRVLIPGTFACDYASQMKDVSQPKLPARSLVLIDYKYSITLLKFDSSILNWYKVVLSYKALGVS